MRPYPCSRWAAGFALALPRGDRKWRLLGVALLAVAVFLRLQNGIFCVALLLTLLVIRRYRESLEATLLLATAGLAYGAVDLLAWGDWFHFRSRLPTLQPARWSQRLGVLPCTYYAKHLLDCPGCGEPP